MDAMSLEFHRSDVNNDADADADANADADVSTLERENANCLLTVKRL